MQSATTMQNIDQHPLSAGEVDFEKITRGGR